MLDFIAPDSSPFLIKVAQSVWPGYIRLHLGTLHVEISESVLNAFRQAKGRGAIICTNHCRHEDPDVLFGVSRTVDECFYFLTAREIFGDSDSVKAAWLQKIGCFSVARGVPDIKSFKAVRRLLLGGKKIVIFPEGEISHQNNFLLDLENGPEHIALSTTEALLKTGERANVCIIPLVLRYEYGGNIEQELQESLAKVENFAGVSTGKQTAFEERLKQLYRLIIGKLQHLPLLPDRQDPFDDTIWLAREQLIEDARKYLGVKLRPDSSQLSRLHVLKGMFCEARWKHSKERERYNFDEAKSYYHKLKIATELCGVGEHSFNHELSSEEKAELLCIVEKICFNDVTIKKPDFVRVEAGHLIDPGNFIAQFKQNKTEAIVALKQLVAEELSTLLARKHKELILKNDNENTGAHDNTDIKTMLCETQIEENVSFTGKVVSSKQAVSCIGKEE